MRNFFFVLVVEEHVLTAAMELFGMSTLGDEPSNTKLFLVGSASLDSVQRRKVLIMAANEIVSKFVNLFSQHLKAKKMTMHMLMEKRSSA